PGLSGYASSKAAQLRVMETIAADVPASEVRFISLHPGAVETAMLDKAGIKDKVPVTDVKLAADFVAWATSDDAAFLAGRFAWVNWDLGELLAKKDEIVEKDLLRTDIAV